MKTIKTIERYQNEMTSWRRDIHAHPEIAFEEHRTAKIVASEIVGPERVNLNPKPAMGSEDFAFMLMEKPGSYIWIGNGDGEGSCMVHNPGYDFNDDILSLGATYWVRMVENILPPIERTGD